MTTSIRFDSISDTAYNSVSPFISKGSYTWSFWYNPASFSGSGGYQTIAIAYRDGGGAWDSVYTTNAGKLWCDVTGAVADTGVTLSIGTWYYITVRRTSDTALEIYVDGVLQYTNTSDISIEAISDSFYIGSEPYGTWSDSNIAFMRIWEAALSGTEINAEKTSTSPVRTTDIYGDYQLQSNTNDSSGNGNNLTTGGSIAYESGGPSIGSDINGQLTKTLSGISLLSNGIVEDIIFNKLYTFDSTSEGISDSGNSTIAFAALGSDGNPSGSVRFTFGTKGVTATELARRSSTGETWTTWGLPSDKKAIKAKITYDRKISAVTRLSSHSVKMRLINSSGSEIALLSDETLSTTTTGWTAYTSGTLVDIPSIYQDEATDVRLEIEYTVTTTSGGGTASIDARFDNINIEITYAPVEIIAELNNNLENITSSSAVQIPVSGILNDTLQNLTNVSSAENLIIATVSHTLDSLSVSASGAVTSPNSHGTLTKNLDNVFISSDGTVHVSGEFNNILSSTLLDSNTIIYVIGDSQRSLDSVNVISNGSILSLAELFGFLDDLASASSVSIDINVETTTTLDAVELVSSTHALISGNVNTVLEENSSTSLVNVEVHISSSNALDDIAFVGSGKVSIYGSLDQSFDGVELFASSNSSRTGDLLGPLEDIVLVSNAYVIINSSANIALSGIIHLSNASVSIKGELTTDLDLSITADGDVVVSGDISSILDDVTLESQYTSSANGFSNITLDDITSESYTRIVVNGIHNTTLDLIYVSTYGNVTINSVLNAELDPLAATIGFQFTSYGAFEQILDSVIVTSSGHNSIIEYINNALIGVIVNKSMAGGITTTGDMYNNKITKKSQGILWGEEYGNTIIDSSS